MKAQLTLKFNNPQRKPIETEAVYDPGRMPSVYFIPDGFFFRLTSEQERFDVGGKTTHFELTYQECRGRILAVSGDVKPTESSKKVRRHTALNDPLEFYVQKCKPIESGVIKGLDLYGYYFNWCHKNGSYARSYDLFRSQILEIGIDDRVTGNVKGRAFCFFGLKVVD